MSGALFGNKKFSKLCLIAVALFIAGALVISAVRDINLREEINKFAKVDLPEMTMQNIKFEREMFGARWNVNVVSMERQGGVVKISSFDASRETDSSVSRIHSQKAIYNEAEKIVELPEGGVITWVISGDTISGESEPD